jgi:predicted ester cyclase
MSVKDSKALERRLYEEYNKGKTAVLAVIDEVYAADTIQHSSSGRDIRGIENYKQHVRAFSSAFPDLQFTIDDMVAEGDTVAVRVTATGTHKGAFRGIPPTNRKVTVSMIQIDRIVGGKFVEGWSRYDTLGLMQQLGLIPTPGKGR